MTNSEKKTPKEISKNARQSIKPKLIAISKEEA